MARVTQRTDALESVDQVDALAAISARPAGALVNVDLAPMTYIYLKLKIKKKKIK